MKKACCKTCLFSVYNNKLHGRKYVAANGANTNNLWDLFEEAVRNKKGEKMMYDCIIIGTGPAGLSAALNLKTYKKSFLWFGNKNFSDKVSKAEKITNYPGFPSISGEELIERFKAHQESA